jgi:hypothetical protein
MAYPTVDKPYGFRPVNLLGGQVFAGSTRQIPIASGHATNIFFGDLVVMSANGCVNNATSTNSGNDFLGVFMGCSYVNSAGQRVFSQYYPATISNTVDGPNMTTAYITDDPDVVMKVAIVSGTTVVAQAARSALVGGNVAWVANTGSTVTGDSAQAVLNSSVTTSTVPIKIVDVVPDTAPASGSFVEVLVSWNQNVHLYRSWTGV